MANDNNTANVSIGKGVAGGYVFRAPAATATVPTDNSTALGAEFECLGFISEDGITESISVDSENYVDMNGDVVYVGKSSREETITMTLIEVKAEALKVAYGASNVTDSAGTITVKHNSDDDGAYCYVFELLMKNNRKWRQVVPNATTTEVGDLTISSGELVGREITLMAAVDSNGDSVIDYIDSTETSA